MSTNNNPYEKYNAELERDIYQRWLRKCQSENEQKRILSEQNNFDKINYDRQILYRVGNIPSPEYSKLYTPFTQPDEGTKISTSKSQNFGRNIQSLNNSFNNLDKNNDLYNAEGGETYIRPNIDSNGSYNVKNSLLNSQFGGIRRNQTSLTRPELYDRFDNDTYPGYKEKQKEFLNYNQHIVTDNIRYKDYLLNEKKKMNEERIKEMQRLKELELQERLYEDEKKRVYKNLLDNQIKVKLPSKLGKLYYSASFNDNAVKFKNPQLYTYVPENSFMNRNKLVEVNPYSLKTTNLGNSELQRNTILNPIFNYKYNHYLFPTNETNNNNIMFNAGQDIVNK